MSVMKQLKKIQAEYENQNSLAACKAKAEALAAIGLSIVDYLNYLQHEKLNGATND